MTNSLRIWPQIDEALENPPESQVVQPEFGEYVGRSDDGDKATGCAGSEM